MQVSNTLLIVAAEIYLMLLIGMLVLFLFSRKQKKLIARQQKKILELIKEIRQSSHTETPGVIEKDYKFYLNENLDVTQKRFSAVHSHSDISAAQPTDGSIEQRVLALRYAFLRAEELGTTEETNTDKYWNVFQQTLEPLLQASPDQNLREELTAYKKRVENLEKFKKLFFDLEAQWSAAQHNSENYHSQLMALSAQMNDSHAYEKLLENYQHNYNQFEQSLKNTSSTLDNTDTKTINIIRQDPRAAEEIIKLRNVAADQYRVINNLQRKLEEAVSDDQKNLIIQELEQQLHRQIRFVQESDTCVQLLEEELIKANEKIVEQEELIGQGELLGEENSHIKDTLHSFTLESKDLLENLETLEEENHQLREQLQTMNPNPSIASNDQEALLHLQKQYAELEERYLALKMK